MYCDIKWGCRTKALCDDCSFFKSQIKVTKHSGDDETAKRYQAELDHHINRKNYKKKIAFQKKVNALKSWDIPNVQELITE